MSDIDIEIIDFMDLMNATFSLQFCEKWRIKYGARMVRLFQFKLLEYFKEQKRLRKSTLTNYLIKRCKYKQTLVEDFYEDIDISLYFPFIY